MVDPRGPITLSVVSAAHNEQDNVADLVRQTLAALEPVLQHFEIVIVDDGSTDGTLSVLVQLMSRHERLRVIHMLDTPRRAGEGNGQSAAFWAGIRAARGEVIALIDADLQNDPADIPSLLETRSDSGADVVQGDRRASRRDSLVRRGSSVAARVFRRWFLGDTIHDTGCSLRVLRREAAMALPLQFRGMHRFIPLTCRQLGYRVLEQPVRHRPRTAGRSKYGIRNRALVGLIDCFAVRWMRSRRRPVAYKEVGSSGAALPPAMPSTETREKAPT